jgi:hypothetical protein
VVQEEDELNSLTPSPSQNLNEHEAPEHPSLVEAYPNAP